MRCLYHIAHIWGFQGCPTKSGFGELTVPGDDDATDRTELQIELVAGEFALASAEKCAELDQIAEITGGGG